MKQIFFLKEFHIWHRRLSAQVKHSYTSPSLCVLYFTGKNYLSFCKLSEVNFNVMFYTFSYKQRFFSTQP